MGKIIAQDVKEIKTSEDFISLLDLQGLKTNYKILTHLQDNMDKYVEEYFKSFFMTLDEVLEYIPESKYNIYKKKIYVNGLYLKEKVPMKKALDKLSKTYPYVYTTNAGACSRTTDRTPNQLFVVDTFNKEIFPVLETETTSYKIDSKKNQLLVIKKFWVEKQWMDHSDYYKGKEYIFDMNTNKLIGVHGHYS